MIRLHTSLTLALALGLSLGTAQAADSPRSAEQLIPAGCSGTFFADFKRIRQNFGLLLSEGRAAAFLDALVSKGLPDLRKDIDMAGVAFDLGGQGSSRQAALVARGTVDLEKVVAFLQNQIGGQISSEAYRGVIIRTIRGSDEKNSFQVAAKDESLTMVSVDDKHAHRLAKPTLDVLAGRLDGYGVTNHVTLPDGYMIATSWTLPEAIRQVLAHMMSHPLSHVVQATAALKVVANDNVRLDVSGRCENALHAQSVKIALKAFRRQLLEGSRLDELIRSLLEKMTIEVDNVTTTASTEVPRDVAEDILGSFVGTLK